jgi:hypothetical protein
MEQRLEWLIQEIIPANVEPDSPVSWPAKAGHRASVSVPCRDGASPSRAYHGRPLVIHVFADANYEIHGWPGRPGGDREWAAPRGEGIRTDAPKRGEHQDEGVTRLRRTISGRASAGGLPQTWQ